MNRIDPTELKEILKKHMLFVTGRPNGQRANLSSQSLSGFGLDKLNLRSIIAAAADFSRCSLSRKLGVSRKQLSDIVNGRSGISPVMAIRLDKAFGGGAETWFRLQAAYALPRPCGTPTESRSSD